MPLIRYNSKDRGKLLPYKKLKELQIQEKYLPPFNSPIALIYWRGDFVEFNDKKVYPELIQEGLYSDDEVASSTTGNFRLINAGEAPNLHIQLKKGVAINEDLKSKFYSSISNYIYSEIPITFNLYMYFPFEMGLDYERKFKHI